ncbi:ankyrin repeat domain-containing protein, partial [Brachyspira pulli]|uniref:ankyrin repeat domain-containing protein n=1 Tax=Brachyspira pulli TaxID=310721 RepID=UPI003006E398
KLENATPLMWFILNDNTEIAELLIESGADINAKDKNGKTALDYAKEKNNSKIEQLLITKGAK